jgi:hypothetical protein
LVPNDTGAFKLVLVEVLKATSNATCVLMLHGTSVLVSS